jgi:hypothetical protein
VDGIGDHQRLGHHAAAITDLEVLGVQPQVRIGALKRPGPELLDVLVEPLAESASGPVSCAEPAL